MKKNSSRPHRNKKSAKALIRSSVLASTLLISSSSGLAAEKPTTPNKSIRDRVELIRRAFKEKSDQNLTGSTESDSSERPQWGNWGNWGNWNNWLNWNNWNNWRNWGNWGNWRNF